SILNVAVDNSTGIAAGEPSRLDVFYDNSPAFRLGPDAALKGVRPVAWFDSDKPLRSGWAWGQNYIEGAVAIAEANVGRGHLYLFGPEITFRANRTGRSSSCSMACTGEAKSPHSFLESRVAS